MSNRAELPELNDDATEEALAEDASQIDFQLSLCNVNQAASLPPIRGAKHHVSNPFNNVDPSFIDLSSLTTLRFAHQMKQGETGFWTLKLKRAANQPTDETTNVPAPKPLSERQQILHGFADIICAQGEKSIGTGLDRAARWRNPTPGGCETEVVGGLAVPDVAGGNSANTIIVADAAAKKVHFYHMVQSQ